MTDAIFCHIPKTAGTSIAGEFRTVTRCSSDHHMWIGHWTANLRRQRVTEMLGERDGKKFWDQCFKFTFIRNPWDRLASIYHFSHRLIPNNVQSFHQWVLDGLPLTDHMKPHIFRLDDKRTLLDQEAWFCKIDTWQEIVNFVGRFERLQQDWQTVCRRLNVAPSLINHANPNKHPNYKDCYTPETKHIVANRFGEFIERYKYTF